MINLSKSTVVRNRLLVGAFLITSLIVLAISKRLTELSIKLPPRQQQRKHILDFRLNSEGHIQAKMHVKRKEFDVIFDTGTYNSVLQDWVPGDFGGKQFKLIDHNGITRHYPSRIIDTLHLGTFKIVQHLFVLQNSKNTSSSGIIGMDILKDYTMTVNFASHTIELTQNIPNPSHDSLSYEKINSDSGLPFFSLRIGRVIYNFLLDTGFDGFLDINLAISKATIGGKKAEWFGRNDLVSYFGRPTTTLSRFYKETAPINIGSAVLENEIVSYNDRKKRSNLAGMDLFKRFEKIIFDFPNRRIYFGKTLQKSLRYYCDLSVYFNGIGITFTNDSLPIITNIARFNSDKNLRIGDTIVGFDHQSLISRDHITGRIKSLPQLYVVDQNTMLSKFAKMIRHARFSQKDVTISIFRDAKIENIELTRQRILASENLYIDYFAPSNVLNIPYIGAKVQKNEHSERILYTPLDL